MRMLGPSRFVDVVKAAAVLLALPAWAAGPITPPAGFFPIGVAGLEPDEFAAWKARGVNTVVGINTPGAWQDFWNDTAVADGLWQIRNPRLNPAQDINQSYLLAWEFNDLPDANKVSASTLATTYAQLKAVDPNRNVLINLSVASAATDAAYTADADWISSEVFPVSALNEPAWIDKTQSSSASLNPGVGVTKFQTLSGGKKQFAYIETSDRDGTGGNRAPTADEVRGETWDAIVHGAKGIIYSPQGSSTDDATPAAVATGITATDALITKYSAVLDAIGDDQSNEVDLGGGLEGTYRVSQGKRYYFVLNDSHGTITDARFALTGLTGSTVVDLPEENRTVMQTAGITEDSFSPYQLHVYESVSAGVGAGVPEPSVAGAALVLAAILRRRSRSGRGAAPRIPRQ